MNRNRTLYSQSKNYNRSYEPAMRKSYSIVMLYVIFILMVMISPATGLDIEYTPNELIIKTSQPVQTRGISFDIPELDNFLAEMIVKEIKPVTPSPQNRYYVVRLENSFRWENLRRRAESQDLRRSSLVEHIQPNYLNKMLTTPNDPLFSQQYLELMRIPRAWNYETGSEQVVVALVDSGLWFDHPEFICQSNIWINEAEYPPNGEDSDGNGYVDDWRGWNFVDAPELADIALGKFIGQDNEPFDETGHGTHIAGIIGAKVNNNEGVAGVCWNVKMMILRAGFRTTTGTGYLQDDDAAAAIIYAADNGAHVMNISWGSFTYSQIIADACQYAYEKGVIIVVSAGNTPQPEVMYPARLNTTIAVGAVDNNLNLTGFSSYGPDLDIVAPGQNILSTYLEQDGELYRRLSGTSMSAPYVTAAVALLLSKEPGLLFNEVKSRLYTSTRDLGTPGFNNIFGNGLLDVERLLTNTFHPFIDVTYPLNNQGISTTFDILGSIKVPDLFRYSVMFTDKIDPTELDWKDVTTHHTSPRYYLNEVENGSIATFLVPYTLPDSDYLVRIKTETRTANGYEKRFRVSINQSAPKLIEESLKVYKRYQGNIPNFFIESRYDQAVTVQIDIFSESGATASVYSNYADSLHILKVPDNIPEGLISLRLSAINNSGLRHHSELFNNIKRVDKTAIPTDTFISQTAGPPLITIGKSFDFDGNALPEFIGMDITKEGTGSVGTYELNSNRRMELKHTFEDNYLPIDMGNTNNAGKEILGLVLDAGIVFETYGESDYPNVALWSKSDVVGGNFSDWNNNGIDDLLIVRNYQNDRVISIFKRSGNTFVEDNILRNTTPTNERNNFVPRVFTADLNRNGRKNVLASDTDGDIMVFEVNGTNDARQIFHHRLPVPNAYHLAIADFTGNGNLEFCVGGYSYLYSDPNKIYWYFEFFGFDQGRNTFIPLGYVSFDHFESINSIKAMDLTGDGKAELILALTPHLYVIGHQDGEFKPIWKGSSHSTYQVVPIPANFNTPAGFLVNDRFQKELYSHFVTLSNYTGPPAPIGLVANPKDAMTVELKWNDCDADYYLIYRRIEDQVTLLDSIITTHYIDGGLEQGVEYQYAVRAYNSTFMPSLSEYSLWLGATPYTVPELISVKLNSLYELRLLFDVQLSNEAVNIGYYSVNNGIGMPSSVNHTHNHRGLLIRFFYPLLEPDEQYYIEINGLTGRSGVPFPYGKYAFDYTADLEPPEVINYAVSGNRELEVYFSKPLNKVIVENLRNYELNLPLVDPFNSISTVHSNDSTLVFTFKEDLKISNQSYFLKMNRIEDRFGNLLPNNKNILKFRVTDVDNLDYVQAVPNPFIRNRVGHNEIQFIGLPLEQEGIIYIYSLSGEMVYGDSIGSLTENQSTYRWNGTNKSRNQIASGTYFYVIKMGDNIKRGQLVIIN